MTLYCIKNKDKYFKTLYAYGDPYFVLSSRPNQDLSFFDSEKSAKDEIKNVDTKRAYDRDSNSFVQTSILDLYVEEFVAKENIYGGKYENCFEVEQNEYDKKDYKVVKLTISGL